MALPFPVSKRQPDPTSTPPLTDNSPTSSDTTTEKQPSPLQSPQAVDLESQPLPAAPPQPKSSRLARLPTCISFWLGYRKVTPPPEKKHVVWIWSFVGAFTCIASIQALFGNVPYFVEKGVPSIVRIPDLIAIASADSYQFVLGSNRRAAVRSDRVTIVPTSSGYRWPPCWSLRRDRHHQALSPLTNRATFR